MCSGVKDQGHTPHLDQSPHRHLIANMETIKFYANKESFVTLPLRIKIFSTPENVET